MKANDRQAAQERFQTVCREQGFPLTWQRRAVFGALVERNDHPTADVLFDAVTDRFPGISRTTVYRVLDTLVELGVASRACHPGAAVRYDALIEPHHHVVCTCCGRMEDVIDPALNALSDTRSRPHGFRVLDVSVYFRGLCPGCRGARTVAPAPRKQRQPKKETPR